MVDYKIEDMKLLNDKGIRTVGKYKVFSLENELSLEEKLQFIDKYYTDKGEGAGTYMYNLINKWLKDSISLPHDSWGYVKTVSLKAWLKKNDSRQIVDDHYHYGCYYFIGRDYTSMSMDVNPTYSSSAIYYSLNNGHNYNIVDQWFHDLLSRLYEDEYYWERDHNPTILKIRKIVEYGKKYGYLGSKMIGPLVWNGEHIWDRPEHEWYKSFKTTKPTESDLDKIISVFEEVEIFMNNKEKEVAEKFGWEVYTEESKD